MVYFLNKNDCYSSGKPLSDWYVVNKIEYFMQYKILFYELQRIVSQQLRGARECSIVVSVANRFQKSCCRPTF